ncbi:histidine permease [Suhomyces tanzawaensis NRRL Y-17324]|uniref:Histidine permease n=1 Tax=Suhomyces tanzawaensis NRRL Y-17324 TaxID=984487 RepID=A0A1E4SEN9_9ASCO|nr:histidine permease [Suhomyces tanzawaensis NRRL Y-17324]ODV77975.1 histidine permease [Suhomyces tanzawaensis NRRL Y-17324]
MEDNLKEYQVKLIALGGAIGSGLFISSAQALAQAGPAGCLIGYSVIAILIYFIVQALGELTSTYPVKGNFLVYSTRFIDESWGFAMNWNYALQWIVTIPLSLVSASLTIEFWGGGINPAVWVAVFYVLVCAINIFGVKGYGYGESFFSIIKVLAIVGFCILAIILIAGGGSQGYVGGKHWHEPGPFAHSLKGTLGTLVNAAFSFAGTELVAIAAGAAPNPRRALSNAIKQIFWRISVFYMLSITLICFLVPYNDPSLLGNSSSSASPFVIAIKNGGVKVLPSIFNAVILLAVLSVANASVFASYKPLVALSEAGHGPKFLSYIDRKGRPIYSILICLAFGLIGFVSASSKQQVVFDWLLAISGLSTIFIWLSISLAQVRVNYACKVQGIALDNKPFNAVGGDNGAYLSIFICIIILMAQFYVALFPVGGPQLDANGFFKAYVSAPIVAVMFVGHKIWTKNWRLYIPADKIDITTGRSVVDPDVAQQEKIEDDERWKAQSWGYRFLHTWC